MRKLLAALIVLLVVIVCLPFGFGLYTHHLLNQLDGLRIPLKEGRLGALEINVIDPQRGWFHSNATLNIVYEEASAATLEPHGDTAEAQANAIPLLSSQIRITHGPILWRPNTPTPANFPPLFGQAWIEAPINYAADNLQNNSLQMQGLSNGQIFGLISLSGTQKALLKTQEFSLLNEQGQLTLAGLEVEIERFNFNQDLLAALHIPQLDLVIYGDNAETTGTHLQMENINFEFAGVIEKLEELWFGTWLGAALFNFDNLQLAVNDHHLVINSLHSTSVQQSNADKKLLDGEGEIDIANIRFNNQFIGPIEMLYHFANFDKAALEYMRGAYNEWLYSDNNQSFLVSLTPAQKQVFFNQFLAFVNALPQYRIDDLNIITPQGNFISNFSLNIAEKAADVQQLQQISYWENSLQASMDTLVAKALLQQLLSSSIASFYNWINPLVSTPTEEAPTDYSQQATAFITQGTILGILKPAGDEFATHLRYDKGVLSVNEKTLLDISKPKQP